MTQPSQRSTHDYLTVVALAALAYSLTVFLHEGTHALTCPVVGQPLTEFGALYVDCGPGTVGSGKLVAGSAPLLNLVFGWLALAVLRRSGAWSAEARWFTWLFMLMNFLTGAGYLMFSGIGNIGDLAVVIDGWQPHWAWRVGLALLGSIGFMVLVWLALKELGKIIGGAPPELYRRAIGLGVSSYLTAVLVIVLAGWMIPYGFLSLPVTAGLAAALGAMSPLIWMMGWFRAEMFAKVPGEPLVIRRRWPIIGLALAWLAFYIGVLGQTLYFG